MTDTQLSPDPTTLGTEDGDEARSRRFRASTYDEAVVAATGELGSAIEVVEANRIRRGGLGGFFATDLGIEITVVPADADAPIRPYLPEDLSPDPGHDGDRRPGALPGQSLGMTDESLQQLLDRVERGTAPDRARASFADLLADVTRAVDTPDTDPTTELPRIEAPALPTRHHRAAARSAPCGFAGATGAFDRAAPFAEDTTVPFTAPFDAPLDEPFDDSIADSLAEVIVDAPDEPIDWSGVSDEATDVTAIARTVTERITAELAAERAADAAPVAAPVAVVLPMDTTIEDLEPESVPVPDEHPDDAPHDEPIAARVAGSVTGPVADPPTDVLTAAAEQLVRELGRIPVAAGSPLHDLDRLRVAVTTPDGNRIEMAVELGAGGD